MLHYMISWKLLPHRIKSRIYFSIAMQQKKLFNQKKPKIKFSSRIEKKFVVSLQDE